MNRPRNMEKFYTLIFLYLSGAFVVMGLLCFAGILRPTAHSTVKEPAMMGVIFTSLGIAFCAVQAVLRAVAAAKDKLCSELLANGTKVDGVVEKVHLQRHTQYGKKSPYRIFYTYTYQGVIYRHKSSLLWEKPDCKKGDPIMVYINNSGKSTIQLSSR